MAQKYTMETTDKVKVSPLIKAEIIDKPLPRLSEKKQKIQINHITHEKEDNVNASVI